ncbi:DUF3426 domain-containing protein [Stenotrophomonas rhizophila]|uniref:DUF3426 domain-containing protein n=1 Tax=Stenotrophomonas rhizophila TaxID=216778 RepID=UPI00224B136D|nr:DUF3426 domain-containing protein [Stenotrophomonas rhizophila]MCX2918855.1 DUF3426 domain-containing protein [Stenotrophomonas rhizophila]
MSEPPMPPRRPLATFLRPSAPAPAEPADRPAAPDDTPPAPSMTSVGDRIAPLAVEQVIDAQPLHAPQPSAPAPGIGVDSDADAAHRFVADAAPAAAPVGQAPAPSPSTALPDDGRAPGGDAPTPATAALPPADAITTPSFLRRPGARLRTPRWQWGMVAGLAALLLVQIAVADRARLAADAGTRPWIAGLCSVLRCALPAWREPTAFSMLSRDVRPVAGVAGALQVQASIRNDARWAQAWPSLRLSLSDADGRVIGTNVFAPADYLDRATDPAATLEPGQSAQIAFRVREPAASTVAFTFEFL